MARTTQYPNERTLDLRPRQPRVIGSTRPRALGGSLPISSTRQRALGGSLPTLTTRELQLTEVTAEQPEPDSDLDISVDSDSDVFEVSDNERNDHVTDLHDHVVDLNNHVVDRLGHEADLNDDEVDLHEHGIDLHDPIGLEDHVAEPIVRNNLDVEVNLQGHVDQPGNRPVQPVDEREIAGAQGHADLPARREAQLGEPAAAGGEQQHIPEIVEPEAEQHEALNRQEVMAENRMLAAVAVKPTAFNGLHPEKAQQWWANFHRYVEFAGIEGANRGKLLGLLLAGTAQLWFDSLTNEVKDDYERLEASFREKYIVLGPNNLQVQMQALARQQLPTETVDEFIADARAKMANFNYNNKLQMTLILNGLRSDVKAIVLQHLPFANIEALAAKAKHVEAALKSYVQAVPTTMPQVNATDLDIGQAIGGLTAKVAALAGQINRAEQRPQGRGAYKEASWQDQQQVKRCFICDSDQHLKRDCPQGQYDRQRQFGQGQSGRPRGFGQGQRGGRGHGRGGFNRGQGDQYNRPYGRGHGRNDNYNYGYEPQVGRRAWVPPSREWESQNHDARWGN